MTAAVDGCSFPVFAVLYSIFQDEHLVREGIMAHNEVIMPPHDKIHHLGITSRVSWPVAIDQGRLERKHSTLFLSVTGSLMKETWHF